MGCAAVTPPAANVSTGLVSSNGQPNYEVYATAPPGAANCSSSTVGAADVVSITPVPENTLSVIGFKVYDYAAKNDTGARAAQKKVTSGSTITAGAINYLNETPVAAEDIY